MTGKDILTAMSDLSMENYALALRPYLNKYLEVRVSLDHQTVDSQAS